MLKRFLEDTLDLVVDLLAKVGILRGDTYWTRRKLRRKLFGDEAAPGGKVAAARPRYTSCPQCGALATQGQEACGNCGARLPGPVGTGLRRFFKGLMPHVSSVSMVFVSLIVAVYLATVIVSPAERGLLSPSNRILIQLGAMHPLGIRIGGEWWRLVNPIFLHGGLLHILFNAYVLANVGPLIESVLERRKFTVLFIGTGIVSFITSFLMMPLASNRFSVGASGALFGLFGYGIVAGYRKGSGILKQAAPQLALWAGINFVIGLSVGVVDNAAHFGGLVGGAAFALLFSETVVGNPVTERLWSIAAAVLAVLPLIGFALALLS